MAKIAPKQPEPKRIFIVDDHPIFREGLVGLVKREAGLTVCGEADSVPQAMAGVKSSRPDLMLADISLPGKNGLELVKDLRAMHPQIAILVISMHDETLYAERVLRAGGRGYIMKQEGPEKILEAIRHVLSGQISVSDKMSGHILDALSDRPARSGSPIGRLSDREFEILQLIGQGKDSHIIAEQLHLSIKTVDAHRGHIKEKLNLKTGAELICYAARMVETQPAAAVM